MKTTIATILIGLALCVAARAQTQPDLVQTPFGNLERHPVPACNRGRVNVFIRFNNVATPISETKSITPVLTPIWIKGSLIGALTKAGYCVYFAPLWAAVMNDNLHPPALNPSLAFSPNETSPKLEDEPPYVLVEVWGYFSRVDGTGGESVSYTVRNRWMGLTPAVRFGELRQHEGLLKNDNRAGSTVTEELLYNIDWIANRIPVVKTKISFEGKELPSTPVCELPLPPTPDEVKATDLNWEKSADAACRVSSMYFDRNGRISKCSDRQTK